MYGDFLVPNNTNVNNAITTGTGAEWELFFEETRDVSGSVGYEWDKDYDNLPLNIKGFMLVADNPNTVTSSNYVPCNVLINGIDTYYNASFTTGSGIGFVVKATIQNGGLVLETANGASRRQALSVSNSIESLAMIIDNINKFEMSFGNINAGTNFKIYILRGV